MTVVPDDPFGDVKTPAKAGGARVADPRTVNDFHKSSDLDSSSTAQHHSLGIKANQASPGDHNHDGRSSRRLLEGVSITGDYSSNTVLPSVVAALVALGATDLTVP